jgi:hypothetical protein
LRAALKEIRQRRRSGVGIEAIGFLDANPGQLHPPARQLVAAARQFFFVLEQRQPGSQPFVSRRDLRVRDHGGFLSKAVK